jgi:hypothetical protein
VPISQPVTGSERAKVWPLRKGLFFSFSHPAALNVEALVERLKRACWMIHIHYLHSDFFEQRAQQPRAEELIEVSLDPEKPQPSSQAFPLKFLNNS